MKKVACFTLDLEADYAGVPPEESYESLDGTEAFEDIVRKYDLKLTTFVTGYILDKDFPVLKRLKALGSRFETHTYSHTLKEPPAVKVEDIRRGIEAYERYFGERPRGYRAPQGLISAEETQFLADEGLAFSSSIFPSFLPGRYNNLNVPTRPFRYSGSGLLEIPMSVVPIVRLPITASHINLLTFSLYRCLMAALGCPPFLNVCTHLYDFADVTAYSSLPFKEKMGYCRTRWLKNKCGEIERLAQHLRRNGYTFAYLSDVAGEIAEKDVRFTGQGTASGRKE